MWLEVDFGALKSGLATVGYRLYDNTGTDTLARTTTGVQEIAQGAYGVNRASFPANSVGIEWDTGEGTPLYAHENLTQYEIFLDTDELQTDDVPGLIAALNDPTAAAVAASVWAEVIEGSYTATQLLRLLAAASGGKLSGAATTNVLIRDVNDSKDRVDATVDVNGNRTAVTLDLT